MKKSMTILLSLFLGAVLLLGGCGTRRKLDRIDIAQAQSVAMDALGITGEALSHLSATLKSRDGREYYEVIVTVDGTDYLFAVDAISGVIIEQSKGTEQTEQAEKPAESGPKTPIGEERAYEIAYTDAGYAAAHCNMLSCELTEEGGRQRYVIRFYGISTGLHYEIDALTGEVISRGYLNGGSTQKTPQAGENEDIDPEMNVHPINPVAEDPAMEIIQPPIDDGPVIYLTPAEVEYPILDYENRETTKGSVSSTDILNAITSDSGYTRTEIKVLARFYTPIGIKSATHVYFTTPDGKYFYYAVGWESLEILRRETADDLSGLSHPLRDSATEVIMPEGMISIEEAYGYALRVYEFYDFDKQTVRTVRENDVILYVAEADYRNGEYEYDFIYQEKETGWFSSVIVRASDGAIRLFGRGKWSKGYFGGFEDMSAVKLSAYQAKTLALSYVPGARQSDVTAFTTDTADGKMEYKGKIVYGGMQFDFTIDGYSGAIREWKATPAA